MLHLFVAVVRAFGWLFDHLGEIYFVAMALVVAASLLLMLGIAVRGLV